MIRAEVSDDLSVFKKGRKPAICLVFRRSEAVWSVLSVTWRDCVVGRFSMGASIK